MTGTPGARKRRGVVTAVIAILGGLALVVGALWGAEVWARQQVSDYIGSKVREALSLSDGYPVSVTIAGSSVLAQLVSGHLDRVDVSVKQVSIGDLSGDVKLSAEGIPIDTAKPVKRVQLEFAATEESVQKVATVLTSQTIDGVELVGSEVRFTSELSIFGFSFDVGVGVEPFVADGEVGFTPTSILLNGNRTDVSEFTATFGPLADALFSSRTLCVAEYLPAALRLESVAVRDDAFLVVTVSAENRVLSDQVLRKPGNCPNADTK